MTEEELKEIEARANAASSLEYFAQEQRTGMLTKLEASAANLAFISHARTDIPALVQEIGRAHV